VGLESRLRRLEDCFGVEEVVEEVLVTQEQQDKAMRRLTDDELEAVNEAAERFGGLRAIRLQGTH
jgi:hypothetical protein